MPTPGRPWPSRCGRASRGIPLIVHASSMGVYGDVRESPVDESLTPPMSFYGASKLAAEHALAVAPGVRGISLRMFSIYGPGQDLAEMRQGMVSIFLAMALARRADRGPGATGPGSRFRLHRRLRRGVAAGAGSPMPPARSTSAPASARRSGAAGRDARAPGWPDHPVRELDDAHARGPVRAVGVDRARPRSPRLERPHRAAGRTRGDDRLGPCRRRLTSFESRCAAQGCAPVASGSATSQPCPGSSWRRDGSRAEALGPRWQRGTCPAMCFTDLDQMLSATQPDALLACPIIAAHGWAVRTGLEAGCPCWSRSRS